MDLSDISKIMRQHAEESLKLGEELRKKPLTPKEIEFQKVISLEFWLAACKGAGYKFVPTKFGPKISIEDLNNCLDTRITEGSALRAETWLKNNLTQGKMWRWDCCAPMHIKCEMSEGNISKASKQPAILEIDDPRFIDIVWGARLKEVGICVRDWVEAIVEDKFPVEFRAYVFKDGVAVSNYYPQRALPEKYQAAAEEAGKKASHLAKLAGIDMCTIDFLLNNDNELIFLEGGPGWGYGASPCCFAPSKLKSGRVVLQAETGCPYI